MPNFLETLLIRPIRTTDFDQIAEIDKKILGYKRTEYWKLKAEISKRFPVASLVAEMDGKIVGFIIGSISKREYGVSEDAGWIDTIGVDPDYQRRGIGQMLFNEMVDHLKKVGVKTIYTFVNWRDWGLLKFFDSIGFEKGDMISLKLDVD